VDFFVSYTSVDRPWAEWIAWQLEAGGYQLVMQAWDIIAGKDWVHQMQQAMSAAERIVVVLSPDYLHSAHGEAEWRPFYARDPSGERGLLLQVRVREVDPPELLKTRAYVDLVCRDEDDARTALMAAVGGARSKPPDEPEFPGYRERPEVNGTEAPRFPGGVSAADNSGSDPLERSPITLRPGDAGAVRALAAQMSEPLRRHKFSEKDFEAFRISLTELVGNAARYVGGDEPVQLRLKLVERWSGDLVLSLEVTDNGRGFDFDQALQRTEADLLENGIEHGLLRAYRLGSELTQVSVEPHVMSWMRERIPQTVPAVFGGKNIIPFLVLYEQEVIQIWETVHTMSQFWRYLERSEVFMDRIFDPLLRPARKYVGIEIIGEFHSEAIRWSIILDELLAFTKRNARFDRQLLLFADSGSDQIRLREYCQDAGITMFEDKSAIRNLREKDVSRMIRKRAKG
jgi:anti-sigma regulatory factor (Ser/Thr protein kinase)